MVLTSFACPRTSMALCTGRLQVIVQHLKCICRKDCACVTLESFLSCRMKTAPVDGISWYTPTSARAVINAFSNPNVSTIPAAANNYANTVDPVS